MTRAELDNARNWCRERLPLPAEDLALAALFTAPRYRPATTALAAIFVELEVTSSRTRDPALARTRLAWWREEFAELEAGRPTHPATRWLAAAGTPPPYAACADLVTGLELELLAGSVTDLTSAERCAEHGFARLAETLVGLSPDEARPADSRELGIAAGLARMLARPVLTEDLRHAVAQRARGRLAAHPPVPPALRVLAALAWRRVSRRGRDPGAARVVTAWRAARGRLPRFLTQA